MRIKPTICTVIALLVLAVGWLPAQNTLREPYSSISKLVEDLPKEIVSGGQVDRFFSPEARLKQKAEIDTLQKKGFLKFEIIQYTLKDLRVVDDDHASLPVTVRWSTRSEELSATVTLRFVRDHGTWFFAEADFWDVSVWWFAVPLIMLAIAYGCGAVIMYRHADRQHWLTPRRKTVWQSLAIVPFVPIFYFARKPWTTA